MNDPQWIDHKQHRAERKVDPNCPYCQQDSD